LIVHYYSILKEFLVEFLNTLLSKFRVFNSERLARYVFSSSHIKRTKVRPKYAAFLPQYNEKSSELETSVFRISGITQSKIWEIGDYVASERNKKASNTLTLKGYARFLYKNLEKYSLKLKIETSSHPLHANIVGWPEEPEERKLIAILLANTAIRKFRDT